MHKGRVLTGVGAFLLALGLPAVLSLTGFPITISIAISAVGVLLFVALGVQTLSARLRSGRQTPAFFRYSEQLADDIEKSFVSPAGSLYVKRDCEEALITRLTGSELPLPQIVSGEAGAGKSSLLWSLLTFLTANEIARAVLISASWLQEGDSGKSLVTPQELLDAMANPGHTSKRNVVLIDTVDLLLHDADSRLLVIDLVRQLASAGVAVMLTTRPGEQQEALPFDLGEVVRLDSYSHGEISAAVGSLVRGFCPSEDPDEVARSIDDAVARGLPVREVCEKPLFLRMMFELAAPFRPHVAEMDVTSLYESFWSNRVEDDARMGTAIGRMRTKSADLSAHASTIAVLMLGLGRPEVRVGILADRVPALIADFRPASTLPVGAAVDTLADRGVILREQGLISFFHQTMFEYAAARGIRRRARAADLDTMLDLVIDNPLDLFVAAVLEQLLIISGQDPSSESACRRSVISLLESGHSSLVSHGLGVVAHHPFLVVDRLEVITALSESQRVAFIERAAAIVRPDLTALLTVVDALWRTDGRKCRLAIVRALTRLAASWPQEITEFARMHKIVDYFLRADPGALANPGSIVRLQLAVFDRRSETERAQVGEMISALDRLGRQHLVAYINAFAEKWEAVGSDELDEMFTTSVTRLIRKRDTDGRSLRQSLGHLVFRQTVQRASALPSSEAFAIWRSMAVETVHALSRNERDLVAGACLFALAKFSEGAEADESSELIRLILDSSPFDAPRRVATHFIVPVLLTEGFARQATISILRTFLSALPVAPNAARTYPEQRAVLARIVLEDERLDQRTVAEIVRPLVQANPSLWRDRAGLLSVLAAGAAENLRGAQLAILDIAADPAGRLDRAARKKFLNEATNYLNDRFVAEAFVRTAMFDSEFGRLTVATKAEAGREVMRTLLPELLDLVRIGLSSAPHSQRFATNFWQAATNEGVFTPRIGEIEDAISSARDPLAKAHLSRLFVAAVATDNSTAAQVADFLIAQRDALGVASPASPQAHADKLSLYDSFTDTALEVLTRYGEVKSVDWSWITRAAVRRHLTGKKLVENGSFRLLNRYLTRAAEEDPELALERLNDTAKLLASAGLSNKQVRDASNYLTYSLRTITLAVDSESLAQFVQNLVLYPAPLAEAAIRAVAQFRRTEARPHFEAALLRPIPASTSDYIAANLRGFSRKVGTGSFSAILAPLSEMSRQISD